MKQRQFLHALVFLVFSVSFALPDVDSMFPRSVLPAGPGFYFIHTLIVGVATIFLPLLIIGIGVMLTESNLTVFRFAGVVPIAIGANYMSRFVLSFAAWLSPFPI